MSSSLSRLRSFLKNGRNALLPNGDAISKVAVIDMLAHNWHLGFTSFGGPTVHFQIFRQLFVEKYKWIDETTYQEMFALCQALSGAGSTKMLYAINALRYGFWTGVLAFFVWSLPMAIAAFGLSLGVQSINKQLPGPAYALLSGLNSATVGIIALAAFQLSQKAITDTLTRVLVFLGGTAGMLYNSLWYFPLLMAAGGAVTIVWDLKLVQKGWGKLRVRKHTGDAEMPQSNSTELRSVEQSGEQTGVRTRTAAQSQALERTLSAESDEEQHSLQPPSTSNIVRSWKTGAAVIATFFATFIVVMVCRGIYGGENRGFDVFANFYLAGTIIFGGGPVVIPLLREYIVSPGWVSSRDFLLGLAITQAFPGPNFNFAVYLGALAVSGSPVPAAAGALIGYVAIFTPGLWLHTGFMGLWSTVRKVQAVRACLRGTHAAAVGLVFTAVYRLFEIGYLDSDVQNGGSLSRDPWWVVIVATSFVGGLHFKLTPPLAILLGAAMGLVRYGVVRA